MAVSCSEEAPIVLCYWSRLLNPTSRFGVPPASGDEALDSRYRAQLPFGENLPTSVHYKRRHVCFTTQRATGVSHNHHATFVRLEIDKCRRLSQETVHGHVLYRTPFLGEWRPPMTGFSVTKGFQKAYSIQQPSKSWSRTLPSRV